ncbi:uncharacterized protein PHACADRAFT_194534 [Phanerochaete carnosa HHB-10118-sp]|uniref:Uncharacterized protein n=1 Tax=Phanerochaete carnosa (strain HHB-10118-sp) TaxID=650164 RepID=K5WD72_PHACS|nr:uncharacterized protein PHACADRAFT_194534 [Phanerochaete carnosa HHB-10118-sp]EKM56959.1 hypothetical protein PHACADRAFT_194534 [Phanerochaete carnosa HHB-10118-sp]
MEKAALGLQNGWVPGDDRDPVNASPEPEPTSPEQASQSFVYSGSTSWDPTLDPRLFQSVASSSSELAGALTLPVPTTSRPRSPTQPQVPALHPSTSVPPDTGCPDASGNIVCPPFQQSRAHTPQQHKGEISVQSISEVAAIQPDGSLPPRFCSIKGCKTVMDGNSLFKMCETCRSKYKTYGNTKRKKWKEEKAKAIAEMERQREEQNRVRAEQGLPPLPAVNTLAWPEDNMAERAVNTSIPRMCTVSHCREILPVGYEYLRCERHRIQNRHHSKLKRVRDKDAKALALEGWFATLAGSAASSSQMVYQATQPYEPPETNTLSEGSGSEQGPGGSTGDVLGMEEQQHASVSNANVKIVEPQVIIFGVPPAARGVRRTNHVCTIKGCHNLLSPSTPWKMCDDCRAHERTVRKIRALRESGMMVDPLPPRMPPRERKEKQSKEKQATRSTNDMNGDGEHSSRSVSPEPNDEDGDGSSLVFINPVLLSENTGATESALCANAEISFVMADQEGNISEPSEPVQQERAVEQTHGLSLVLTPAQVEPTPVTSKKKTKKDTNKLPSATTATAAVTEVIQPQASASVTLTTTASSPTLHSLTAAGTPAQQPLPPAPYGVPCYMPPPGYGVPYPPPGAPYPFAAPPPPQHLPPAFPRDGFAPSPMFQPPYAGYAGYPLPYPPPYGYYPHPYPYLPPPPPLAPGIQPLPPHPQAPDANESISIDPTTSTNQPSVPSAVATSGNNAASAPAPTPASSPWRPSPPADPSIMYSMFPVRLVDTSRSAEGTISDPATAGLLVHPPPATMITMSVSEKHKQTEVIFVDKPPEKRKRRKADMAAVEAYLKRREEERVQAGQSSAQADVQVQSGNGIIQSQAMPTSTPNIQPVLPVTPAPVNAAASAVVLPRASESPPQSNESQLTRPCGNKLCNRTLSAADIGTICERCKEKIKKRTLRVKKRFKLVKASPSSSSKLLEKARLGQQDPAIGEDNEGEGEDVQEMMVGHPAGDPSSLVLSSTTFIGTT